MFKALRQQQRETKYRVLLPVSTQKKTCTDTGMKCKDMPCLRSYSHRQQDEDLHPNERCPLPSWYLRCCAQSLSLLGLKATTRSRPGTL